MIVADAPHAPSSAQQSDTLPTNGLGALRIGLFSAVAITMAFPDPSKLTTHLPGNPGDAFLCYWIMGWGARAVSSLYSGYWSGPIFGGSGDTMAYTETLLPLTPLHRVLSVVSGSPVLSMNVIYLASWVVAAEATFRIVRRVTGSSLPGYAAAFAFTYSTIRIAQTGHYQLAFACFIPLGLLLLFRMFEHPSIGRGVAVGAVTSVQFLTTGYYGILLFVGLALATAMFVVFRREHLSIREHGKALAAAVIVVAVLVLPVALRYQTLQGKPGYRDAYPAGFALRLGDLRTAAPLNRHLQDVSFLQNDSDLRSSENFAYVGLFVLIFTPAGVIAMLRSKRYLERRWEIASITLLGLVAFLIAVGRAPVLGFQLPFYDLARHTIPGVKSMLALVRLFVFTQLALVIIAAVGFDVILRSLRLRTASMVAAGLVSVLVLYEARAGIPLVEVPRADGNAEVYDALKDLPNGIVVELPMAPTSLGALYAFTEATRMVLATDDAMPRLNGYSGYTPPGYAELVEIANTFPSSAALAEFERHNVRYVLVHTSVLKTGNQSVTDASASSGFAFVDPTEAELALDLLPDAAVCEVRHFEGAILVELQSPSRCVETARWSNAGSSSAARSRHPAFVIEGQSYASS